MILHGAGLPVLELLAGRVMGHPLHQRPRLV